MDPIGLLFDAVAGVPAPVAYAVVGLLVLTEAGLFLGVFIPGDTAAILAGALAATGRLSLGPLLAVVIGCAVVGDSLGYELGRRAAPRVLASRLGRRHARRIEAARRFLERHGPWAVVLARFVSFLRALVPGTAGLMGMPYRRFVVANAFGGVVWGFAAVLGGYLVGRSFTTVAATLGQAGVVVLAVAVVLVVVALAVRRRLSPSSPSSPTSPSA